MHDPFHIKKRAQQAAYLLPVVLLLYLIVQFLKC